MEREIKSLGGGMPTTRNRKTYQSTGRGCTASPASLRGWWRLSPAGQALQQRFQGRMEVADRNEDDRTFLLDPYPVLNKERPGTGQCLIARDPRSVITEVSAKLGGTCGMGWPWRDMWHGVGVRVVRHKVMETILQPWIPPPELK